MFFWLQVKWLTFKLSVISTRISIRRAFIIRKVRWRLKMIRTKNRAQAAKKKTIRATKDLILPSLPGVSKLALPETPVPHLLCSNIPPTDPEIVQIEKAIVQAQVMGMKLKDKLVERVEAGQSSRGWETVTRHKIGRTARFIQQHEGTLSPIRRLPCEILQEIFIWTTPLVRLHTRWRSVAELPWELAQVCQSWRESALALSTLWNHLPAISFKRSRRRITRQVECMSELLRRSKETPLDIFIYSQSFTGTSHPTIDLLAQHSERWQVVSIESTPAVMAAFHSIKGHLSSLKILTLQTRVRYTDPPPPLDIFAVAPQLQVVSVSGPLPEDLKLPYSQLVHYKGRLITTSRINQAVTSPLLESLTFLELSDDIVFPDVTIPNLTKLQVKFHCRSRTNCFDHLVLPAIEEIKVVSWGGNLISSLAAMISRAEPTVICPLHTLSVRTDWVEAEDLTALLKLTPKLVYLDTTLPPSYIDIHHMASREQQPPIAPLLETCKFYVDEIFSGDIARALNELAAARCGLPSNAENGDSGVVVPGEICRLKTLCLYFDGGAWSHTQQAVLENWEVASVTSAFSLLKTQLILEVPELTTGRARTKISNKKWAQKVVTILDGIMAVKVEDPKDIYVSSMHLLLRRFSEINYPRTTDAGVISHRAQEVLEHWHPLFLEHLPRRHWAFQGPYAMVYVSDDDAIRTSDHALDIVYGLKPVTEDMSFPAVFWPMFMSHS